LPPNDPPDHPQALAAVRHTLVPTLATMRRAGANSPRASRWNGIEVPGIIQSVIGLGHRPFTV
jgi:hypothetical protein